MCGRGPSSIVAVVFLLTACSLRIGTCQPDCAATADCHRDGADAAPRATTILAPKTAAAAVARGMKKKMMDFIPYLIVPAFAMAGIMPWIIPPLKAAVMFVAMINNMAFSSALFMLIRNYIFNTEKDEHIIYLNHGYKNNSKKPPPNPHPQHF